MNKNEKRHQAQTHSKHTDKTTDTDYNTIYNTQVCLISIDKTAPRRNVSSSPAKIINRISSAEQYGRIQEKKHYGQSIKYAILFGKLEYGQRIGVRLFMLLSIRKVRQRIVK